jgi:hypothetical protein
MVIGFGKSVQTDIGKSFLKHLERIPPIGKLKITKQIAIMLHHYFYRAAIQGVKVLCQSFHIIRHHHSREVITNHKILIMLFRRMFANPGTAEEFFKTIRLCTVVVVSQLEMSRLFPKRRGRRKTGAL